MSLRYEKGSISYCLQVTSTGWSRTDVALRASVRRHRRAQGGSPMLRSIRPTRAAGTLQLTSRGGRQTVNAETSTCRRGHLQRRVRRPTPWILPPVGGEPQPQRSNTRWPRAAGRIVATSLPGRSLAAAPKPGRIRASRQGQHRRPSHRRTVDLAVGQSLGHACACLRFGCRNGLWEVAVHHKSCRQDSGPVRCEPSTSRSLLLSELASEADLGKFLQPTPMA